MPPTSALPPGLRRRTRVAVLAAATVAVATFATGCSSSASSSPQSGGPSKSPVASGGAPPMATTVTFGKVAGTVQKKNRKKFRAYRGHLKKSIREVVDSWFDNAFVGVGYPRDGFGDAFIDFTPQAARDARGQKKLMTLWKLRHDIQDVAPTRQRVWLDVLAPHGVAAGVTARFSLELTTSGHRHRKVTESGRLFLTKNATGNWRIFGYDVSQGVK